MVGLMDRALWKFCRLLLDVSLSGLQDDDFSWMLNGLVDSHVNPNALKCPVFSSKAVINAGYARKIHATEKPIVD